MLRAEPPELSVELGQLARGFLQRLRDLGLLLVASCRGLARAPRPARERRLRLLQLPLEPRSLLLDACPLRALIGQLALESPALGLRFGEGGLLELAGIGEPSGLGSCCRGLAEARQGPPVRKRRFTYWTLRRRVSAPVTHHGLDGLVTLLIADARNARLSRPVVGSVVGVAEVV